MKAFNILATMALATCTLTATAQSIGTTFSSGKLKYQIVSNNNEVQIAPNGDNAYSGISQSDFASTVSYNGRTYKVIGVGAGAFSLAKFSGNISLPEGIWYIDNAAFITAEGGNVTIPSTVQAIVESAFIENKFTDDITKSCC